MDTSKILQADLLDLIFDDRNKLYGAYELRKSYSARMRKALIVTGCLALLGIGGAVFANSMKTPDKGKLGISSVVITDIKDDPEVKIIEPEKKKKEVQQETRTEKLNTLKIVPDEEVDSPIPDQEELANAIIDIRKTDGLDDVGIVEPGVMDGGKDIIEAQKPKEDEILMFVEVPAKYDGNWERFLTRNLVPEVPIDHGAPPGRYTAIIQFVVDRDGSISDIKALTSHGYGIEEEAIRVIRKAQKWEPGIQNGYAVKSYRRQPVTFVVGF